MCVLTEDDKVHTINPDDYELPPYMFNIILYHKYAHGYDIALHPKYNGIRSMEELKIRCDMEGLKK